MSENIFLPFPKIYRLSRPCIITEKIDGTNAQVIILRHEVGSAPLADFAVNTTGAIATHTTEDGGYELMYAGSRTRLITPEADNMGFARWVQEHAEELWALGAGRHFGEWWGSKIQRGYGLKTKHFSLFNVSQWCAAGAIPKQTNANDPNPKMTPKFQTEAPACCGVVPTLYEGLFTSDVVEDEVRALRLNGSVAAPGFMQPEGVVVFHTPGGYLFKKTLEKDEAPKGPAR